MSVIHSQDKPLPRDFLQSWMIRRVARELERPEVEIDPGDHLMTLGIDSLMLIGLAGELAELVGRDLPAEIFWEYESIGAIAEHLAAITSGSAAGVSPPQICPDTTTRDTYLDEARRWSPIRAIQPHGTKAPLFLVHGVAGGVTSYNRLSEELGQYQPIFGLQQPPEPPESVEQMAAVLLDGLRTIRRKGPYRLGGYCFGGVIAYEMARQLEAMGERVDLLAMFDSPSLRRTPQIPLRDMLVQTFVTAYTLIHGPIHLAREFLDEPLQVVGRVKRRLGRWSHRLRYRFGLTKEPAIDNLVSELFGRPRDIHRKNVTALRDYCPKKYSGSLTFFQSAEFRCFHGKDLWQWHKLATGGINLCRIPGNHDVMLSGPAVKSVAEQLRIHLERSEC